MRRLGRGRDVDRAADHVDDVRADPCAVADGHGALEPVYAGGRFLEQVDEDTRVDASVAGRGDRDGVHVVVVIGVGCAGPNRRR